MDNLEKYLDQVMEQKPVVYETPAEPSLEEEPQAKPDLLRIIARRWPIVLVTAFALCALALPAVWLLVAPVYEVQGTVRVRPAESILTGTQTTDADYRLFVNSEANTLKNDQRLLERIASRLVDRGLAFFSGEPQTPLAKLIAKVRPSPPRVDMVEKLREALMNGTITVGPLANSQHLAVTMKNVSPEEARVIVNSFLINYQELYGLEAEKEETDDLNALTDEQAQLARDMDAQRAAIAKKAESYGSTSLATLYDMELNQQRELLSGLTQLQSQESALLARLRQLDANNVELLPERQMALRAESVNSDPTLAAIAAQIATKKQELISLRQARKPGHPILVQQEGILAGLEQELENRRAELEQKFDERLTERQDMVRQEQLASVRSELEQVRTTIKAQEDRLAAQVEKTRAIGNTNLEIENLGQELDVLKSMYEIVTGRIRRIAVEGQGRPRVTPGYEPSVLRIQDRRLQLSAGVFFVALGCGVGLALLRDKMDKTLQTADDVTRCLDLPVLGTTSNSQTVKPAQFAEQIAADYQAIRTNLGLLTNGGIPRKLAVSSPGMREGKTTFAVNLATSLAKGGKKVLLIDGDLRKPDVRYMLNVNNGAAGIQDVLLGSEARKAISSVSTSGLHVLAASSRNVADVYELLVSSRAAEQIERLGREYDHLIIDTPPVLAFPDALIWARLAGAVVLVGFAGQTTAPDLKEAKEKFARVRVQVLGAILSSVRAEQNPYRYGYSYRAAGSEAARKARRQRKLLLSPQSPNEAAKGTDS